MFFVAELRVHSSRNHQLAPCPNSSNSTKEKRDTCKDVNVSGELFGRPNLVAKKPVEE